MALDIKDDKDLNEKFSYFFSKNKKNILLYAVLFLLIYFVAIYLKDSRDSKILLASSLYQKVQLTQNISEAEAIVDELKSKFSNTAYASRASIFLGNLYFKDRMYDDAIKYYIWSSENALEHSIKSLSYYQLALCYYIQNDYESGLKLALNIDEKGFTGLKYYMLGDIYSKLNKNKEALESYKRAFDFYVDKNDLAKVLKIKIDAIGQE